MRIKSVRIRNYRCISDAELHCDALTALVGRNGTGKSSFLRALELFYSLSSRLSEEDFHGGNTDTPIVITVTFHHLTDSEKELFTKYVNNDVLTVEKEIAFATRAGSQKYYGITLANRVFQDLRNKSKVTEQRPIYQQLRANYPELPQLPGNTSGDAIRQALEGWEETHPEQLEWVRDSGQFFGFKEVGIGNLERYTRFLYIPAVREASDDATEGKGSVISELLDLVIRSRLSQHAGITKFSEDTQKGYEELIKPLILDNLSNLSDQLSQTLGVFAPNTYLKLQEELPESFEIPLPKAKVRIAEDEYETSIEHAGHGTQRAFIMTVLQHLAVAQQGSQVEVEEDESEDEAIQAENEQTPNLPSVILGIEEPELYQHPTRQRHLSRILWQLATGSIAGVAASTQVIYTTHSPLFVDLQKFPNIRVIRKIDCETGEPKQTSVCHSALADVIRETARADGSVTGSYSEDGEAARLQTLMTPWTNEGFFSDLVVLVEGEEDRAAIIGVAESLEHSFEQEDIAIIPCMGKNNLVKAAAVFKSLSIPVYIIWDSDFEADDAKPEENHRLLRYLEVEIEDYPNCVADDYACFSKNLTTTLEDEITRDVYDEIFRSCKTQFGYPKDKQAKKNPLVLQTLITQARERGRCSPSLESIVEKILLKHQSCASIPIASLELTGE